MIDVCCAIIKENGRILAVQRGPETSHPFQWEFPGGKIQEDETAEESIVREIREELSVEIEITEQLESVEHDYGTKQIRLIPFVCRMQNEPLYLTEHIAFYWIMPDATKLLNWSGADLKLIQKNDIFFRNKQEIG